MKRRSAPRRTVPSVHIQNHLHYNPRLYGGERERKFAFYVYYLHNGEETKNVSTTPIFFTNKMLH